MFHKFSSHVYYRLPENYSDRPTIGYIKGDKFSILFESGSSKRHAHEIQNELLAQKLPLPSFVAVSHWHWDHTFGICGWNVPVIAGKETNRHLKHLARLSWDEESIKERVKARKEIEFCYQMMKREYASDFASIEVVPADIEFKGDLTLDLGGVHACLIPVGGPHSWDSGVCYIAEERFVFRGDSGGMDVYLLGWSFGRADGEDLVPTLSSLPFDEDLLQSYREVMEGLDFDTCIPGHAGIMSKTELFSSLRN